MKRLYYVRHGESALNAKRIYAGQTDTPLTERGRTQAHAAGETAKPLSIDLIVASPLGRTVETATIIAAAIDYPLGKIVLNKILVEQSYGSLEGLSWDVTPDRAVYPDIETDEALGARAQQALDYLHTLEEDDVLVVGHGSFALAMLKLLHPDTIYDEPTNAKVVQFI